MYLKEHGCTVELYVSINLSNIFAGRLLARAKLLMNTPGYKLYSRPGNYARAKADFIALQLTDVRPLQVG